MEKISTERLAGWGERAARSIPIKGRTSGRRAARRLARAMEAVAARGRDEKAPAWFADNEYLARRETDIALGALRAAGRLRKGRSGPAVVALCRALAEAGPVTEERIEAFLTGARRSGEMPENEAALFGAALRAALVEALAGPEVDAAEAGELFTSLRTLADMDLTHALEASDPVDALLRQDGVYPAMDEASRAGYRRRIQRLAKAKRIPAVEAARQALEGGLHEYLFPPCERTGAGYMAARICLPAALAVLAGAAAKSVCTALLAVWPLSELVRVGLDSVLLRLTRPRRLPRLELKDGVGPEGRTVCAVSALLTDDETGVRLARRLEEYALANRACGQELLFALLADLPDGAVFPPPEAGRLQAAAAQIDTLNETYGGGFFLLSRDPVWHRADGVYAPWERKRGAVLELARLVQGRPSHLKVLAGDPEALHAKYILCLDGDTRLVPGSARQLIGAAMHPLNAPQVEKGAVVKGHGVLHPRMAVELDRAMATDFARIWAGQGGTDPYGAPTGELYTDLFDRGGFAGKGVVDAAAYLACLDGRFEDDRVLSHDALEGAYLRGAYVGDVELTDGAPVTAAAWFRRLHRWTRGDWQNLPWLFRAGRDLPALERFRLFDSVRRSLVPPTALAALIWGLLSPAGRWAAAAALVSLGADAVHDAFAGLFQRRSAARLRIRSGVLRGAGGSLTRFFARLIFLPWEGWTCASAAVTALWRMKVSHKHMLQWVTAAQTDRGRNRPAAMWFSVALGLALAVLAPGPAGKAAGVVWACAPAFAWASGRPIRPKNDLTGADRAFLLKAAGAMWGYFAERCVRSDHWLPPDNVQVQPPKGAARRTSPTNIGLALTSALGAMELGLAPESEAAALIERILATVEKLDKWRGHLYNWYDTGTCAPLTPAYVSAVDSGNLCACLICLAGGMAAHGRPDIAQRARALADDMDLGALYDEKKRLFRIGLDPATDEPSPGHYDLMASEARLLSYVACARGDVPVRHWQSLSRAQLSLDGWRGLASWSGSMFEYLMPELFLPFISGSMLWETARFCLYAQRRRGERAKAPWGCSESAFFSLDAGMDYRYKAHGVGALALRRDVDSELVAAPYASFLALAVHPKAAVKNLRRLKTMDMWGRYGFYEALDLTPGRTGPGGQPVACFMSHHIGMSLAAVTNCLASGALRRYFMADPAMGAFKPLLAERVPLGGAVLRRSRSPLSRPPESRPDRPVFQWEGPGHDPAAPAWFPMSNGVYTLLVCDDGRCIARTAGLLMYRPEGFSLAVDGVELTPSRREGAVRPWRYEAGSVTFTARRAGGVMSAVMAAASGEQGELRRVTGPSGGKLTVRFEPVLAPMGDHQAHPAFWRLGLEVSARHGAVLVRRLARGARPESWLCLAATVDLIVRRGAGWQMHDPVFVEATLPEGGCAALGLGFGGSAREAEACARAILTGGTADMAGAMGSLLGMSAEGLKAAFQLCAAVCSPRAAAAADCTREALWKHGLSGDLPIVYVSGQDMDDARRMIKRHALITACGAAADLVIDTGEEGQYLHPKKDALRRYLDKYGLASFENARGGVWFMGGQGIAAAAVLPAPEPARREPGLPALRPAPRRGSRTPEVSWLAGGAVRYDTPPLPPRAWCNVLTNGRFGYLAADCGTGFMWLENARECPVDPWGNDPIATAGGETLELVTAQGRRSLFAGEGACRVTNGFGWTAWEREGISLTAFVPNGFRARVFLIDSPEGYLQWHLPLALAAGAADRPYVITGHADGCLTAMNPRSVCPGETFRAVCSRAFSGFTGDEAAFLAGRMDGKTGPGLAPCFGALWKSGGLSVLVCGFESAETLKALADPDRAAKELMKVRDGWRAMVSRVHIRTPDEDLNRMMNGWAAYQTLACRIMGRTSMYQSGGAWGFRDQLQDAVNLILIAPSRARKHILTCCARQFREGDVLHWWHEGPEGPRGVRTRCSDDLLWLPWALCEYVEKTGDMALCGEKAPWLEAPPLRPEEQDRYFQPPASEQQSTVLDHARKAMDQVLSRGHGPHGLLFTGSGDWNDGMDKVGGESVWLTWFFAHTARRFAALLGRSGSPDAGLYAQAGEECAAAAERSWNGSWYLRGWWADGAPLGGVGSPACAIDSIAQSWAAFCPEADRERVGTALRAAVDHLYDRAHGVVKLFAPPFGDEGRDPGYIRACGPGFRENGGQYTHGAVWLASALLKEGFSDAGTALLLDLLPARHDASRWGTEPYVLAADVSANPDHYGEALWSWYTGSAGWFFRVVLEDLLGIRLENGRLTVAPRLPHGWDGYEADICGRHITVEKGSVRIT